ncbi:hypothetical protein CH063_04449 [Colletotrichum higginsianum]|uniref:Ubiquitin-like protein n=1 Tax=Colletotrichum higginsianum (strain IMI 349063) TaxID=759273 RepID=H1UVH7_COLHI|nr:Ubiquitin-like protein [Colletotrichum higginsianum IMI 349063]OBR06796.1 Ubiquitin-like protein [Colletotrichum higginsianum IMI 349063]CCF31978.1 hypothetical protein CH063_04449 [Colletotrichum higginsianum]
MEVTLEAIIAIVSLVVGLPPALLMLWRCCQSRRRSRTAEHRSIVPNRSTSFETMPQEENMMWLRSPVRVWTFVGYQMDLMPRQPVVFPPQQAREPRDYNFQRLRDLNT